jgi:GLPGLI family protein
MRITIINLNSFVLIFSLIQMNFCLSQSILVEYKIIPNGQAIENTSENDNSEHARLVINETFQLIKLMTMHLKANRNNAIYWGENEMTNDYNERYMRMAKIFINEKSKFYYDLNSNLVSRSFKMFDQNYIINNEISGLNWELKKETKQIDKYLCYKAITNYKIINSKGTFVKQITAWYAFDIPYRFGPKGYCGLPGLIIELNEDKVTYLVKKILFSDDIISINQLPKAKIITQKEIDEIAIDAMEARRSLRSKKG